MRIDRRFEKLLRLRHSLNVIDVGVRRDQHLAFAQREVHLPDQLDDFLDRLLQADIDEQPIASLKHEINAAAEDFRRLKTHLDDIRKYRLAGQHEWGSKSRRL